MEELNENEGKIETQLKMIQAKLQSYLTEYSEYVKNTREFIKRQNDEHKKEFIALNEKINSSQKQIEYLKNEYLNINKIVENNKKELVSSIEENTTMKDQINLLENRIRESKVRIQELNSRMERQNYEIKRQENQKKNRISMLKESVSKYKKYLGLEIVPIKDSVIKIEFFNITRDSQVSYIVLDFSEGNTVTDCYPLFNSLESINFLFLNHNDFYEFLKVVRSQFKAYLTK